MVFKTKKSVSKKTKNSNMRNIKNASKTTLNKKSKNTKSMNMMNSVKMGKKQSLMRGGGDTFDVSNSGDKSPVQLTEAQLQAQAKADARMNAKPKETKYPSFISPIHKQVSAKNRQIQLVKYFKSRSRVIKPHQRAPVANIIPLFNTVGTSFNAGKTNPNTYTTEPEPIYELPVNPEQNELYAHLHKFNTNPNPKQGTYIEVEPEPSNETGYQPIDNLSQNFPYSKNNINYQTLLKLPKLPNNTKLLANTHEHTPKQLSYEYTPFVMNSKYNNGNFRNYLIKPKPKLTKQLTNWTKRAMKSISPRTLMAQTVSALSPRKNPQPLPSPKNPTNSPPTPQKKPTNSPPPKIKL